jgi:hypothetical protein
VAERKASVISNSSCQRLPIGRSGLYLASSIAARASSTGEPTGPESRLVWRPMGTSGKRARDDRPIRHAFQKGPPFNRR